MKLVLITIALLFLSACGGESSSEANQSLGSTLRANDSWPQEIVGVLDIVEAGYHDSDYPEWALGAITTANDADGLSIEITDGLLGVSGVNIDDGKTVKVWVDKPHEKYGVYTFPVSKIKYQ